MGLPPQGSAIGTGSPTGRPSGPARPPTRVLWVTRRYWPHGAGRHARAAASLETTSELASLGMQVEVVTPRYGTHWSHEFFYDSIRVHRVASAPKGEWSMQRYVRQLGNWIADQASRLDWIVCDGINEDVRSVAAAMTQIRSTKSSQRNTWTRSAVVCDGWGGDGDDVWCRQARGGRRSIQAVSQLDRVISRHAALDRFLIGDGVPPERIVRIAPGFQRPGRVSLPQRLAARNALAQINTDLKTTPDDRVLLWCGHMTGRCNYESSLGLLVGSARIICARYPNLKIWMIGDGEMHDWIHTELKAEGVRSVVAIPGTFSDMTEVWNCVDGVVVSDEDQLRYTLPHAIGLALPTVLADSAGIRAWVKDKFTPEVADSFAWYDARKPSSFRKTFRTVWDDLPTAVDLAWEVAMDASRRFSMTDELNQWASVLSSDAAAKSSS